MGSRARRTHDRSARLHAVRSVLTSIVYRYGAKITYVKTNRAEGDLDVLSIRSNTFELEWPPKSGKMQNFAEIDRAEWFDLPSAHAKIIEG